MVSVGVANMDNPGYSSEAEPPSYSQSMSTAGAAATGMSLPVEQASQPYPQPYQPPKHDPAQQNSQQQQFQQLGAPYPGQQPYPQPYQPNQTINQQIGGGVTVVQPAPAVAGGVVLVAPPEHYFVQTYFVMSCITFWFINCLFGGIAMIFSCMSMSARDGQDYAAARRWGRVAMWLSVTGMIISGIIVLVLVILLAVY